MNSTIYSKISTVTSAILLMAAVVLLLTSTLRTNAMLNDDSDEILLSVADYYTNVIDDNFRSAEQSVGTISNYALAQARSYPAFLHDEAQRSQFTRATSELAKSIAENTRGAMAVYLRFNPERFGPTSGFWYNVDRSGLYWEETEPTDMSLYDPSDREHVGWYYVPVSEGRPMWMDPSTTPTSAST